MAGTPPPDESDQPEPVLAGPVDVIEAAAAAKAAAAAAAEAAAIPPPPPPPVTLNDFLAALVDYLGNPDRLANMLAGYIAAEKTP